LLAWPDTKSPQSIMQGKFLVGLEVPNPILSPRPASNFGLKPGSTHVKVGAQENKMKEVATTKAKETRPSIDGSANNNDSALATK